MSDDRIIEVVEAGKTAGDGWGLWGTTRVISHYFDLAGSEGSDARTLVTDRLSGPYPPEHSPS